MLTCFVAYLYKERLKTGTIKSYLADICHTQIALGLGNLHIKEISQLEYVIHGVKRHTNGPTHSRYPITLWLLAQMHHFWSDRHSAMLCMGSDSHVLLWITQNRRGFLASRCQL